MSFSKKGKKQSMRKMLNGVIMGKSINSNGNQKITLNSNKLEEMMFSMSSEEQLRNIFDRSYDMMIKEKGYEESDRELSWETQIKSRVRN